MYLALNFREDPLVHLLIKFFKNLLFLLKSNNIFLDLFYYKYNTFFILIFFFIKYIKYIKFYNISYF